MAIPVNFKFHFNPQTPTGPTFPYGAPPPPPPGPTVPQDGFTPGGPLPSFPTYQPLPGFDPNAGPATNFNDIAADFQAKMQAKYDSKLGFTGPGLEKPGSLVVVDNFQPVTMMGPGGFGPPETPHGHLVSASAKGQGFAGNLIASEYQPTDGPKRFQLRNDMAQADLPPDDFKKLLDERITQNSVGLLDTVTRRLEGLQEGGLNHSAVNLSYGADQASTVRDLYSDARDGWTPGPFQQFKEPMLDNYARAFGLDKASLISADPEVSGPERGKLQQALIDHVRTVTEGSGAIKESRQRYDQAVHNLEQNHNSVVVSASNGGNVLKMLQEDAPQAAPLKVGPGFYDNVLANSETTVVGATTGRGENEKPAGYTSDYKEVDVYANGTAPASAFPGLPYAQGTSFASPKVAAVMAQLHELYPDKSSQEIEAMLKQEMSHQLLSYDGKENRPVLNPGPEPPAAAAAPTFLSPYWMT